MWRLFSITFLAICLSIASPAFGTQPRITRSSLSSQLHQPTVSAIHRDSRGILWIGTQQGLHRFDGATLTVFDSDRSNKHWIPDSEIKDIAEDNDGNLLVATSGGVLLKLDRSTETFAAIKRLGSVDRTSLVRLLVSKRGDIWLLSRDGLTLFDPIFQHTEDWVMNLDLTSSLGRLHDLLEDEAGNVWVGGSFGVAKILRENESMLWFDLKTLRLSKGSRVTALEKNSNGDLIIGTDTGQLLIWSVDANSPLVNSAISGNAPNYISEFELHGDMVIIATDRGVYASDNHLSFIEDLSNTGEKPINTDVYSLFRDGKYMWVGTINGLDILSFASFDLFNADNSGVSNDILAFEEDREGHIWVGTYSGLYRYNEATKTHAKFELNSSASNDQRVSTIAPRKNELWLGFLHGGVQVVDINGDYSVTPNLTGAKEIAIAKILITGENQDALIATYDHGLFRIKNDDVKSYYEDKSLPEKLITVLFQSKTKILLAVSENKVYQHDALVDHFKEIEFEFGLGGMQPTIYSFAQTRSDDILIGTKDHGLFIWPRKSQLEARFKLQPTEDSGSLGTSTIYGIEPDSQGNLWCSTQNGILKLNPKGRLIKRFTAAEGLQGNDFAFGASFTSREGLIYFGGVNGYNRFDPAEVSIDNSPSPMRLTNISLAKHDSRTIGAVNELKTLQLTYRDHFVTFQFSVLDFLHPEGNRFRYKLENFDPDWVDGGTRNTATYTNLPAGEYVLRVQGANSAGIWNRDGITLGVHVLPAPWRTWWAFAIYSMASVLLMWGAHRIYHSYAIDRRSTQMAREMFEAENKANDDMQEQLELQDELIQSAYQHNLTTLSLVSDCITYRSLNQPEDVPHDLTDGSLKPLAALASLEDCLYYQAGGPVVNLQKYTDSIITALLARSPVNPESIITINEVSSSPLSADLASPLSIVMYELLENCIQHAFLPGTPANYIQVKLVHNGSYKPAGHYLELSVRDSGVGVPEDIENLKCESSGIAIVLSTIRKLGGTVQFASASGTTVSITLPNPEIADFPCN